MDFRRIFLFLFLLAVISTGCREEPQEQKPQPDPIAERVSVPPFSGSNAYDLVARQVAFGPRNPNSEGAARAVEFFGEYLQQYADTVWLQTFEADGYDGEVLRLTNVIATFNPAATQRVLLCAHWDTRPWADHDSDPTRRDEPILGANDAGSGVAVLLELARIMGAEDPAIGVDIVLFDGEDYGISSRSNLEHYFLGSKYFSRNLPAGYDPAFGVLLDIVGDHDASFRKEGYSMKYAPGVVEVLWNLASELDLSTFVNAPGESISDDHLPLNEIAGIPTANVIDGALVGHDMSSERRQYWHTTGDTMDNISSETLSQVGELMVHLIYRVAPQHLLAS